MRCNQKNAADAQSGAACHARNPLPHPTSWKKLCLNNVQAFSFLVFLKSNNQYLRFANKVVFLFCLFPFFFYSKFVLNG